MSGDRDDGGKGGDDAGGSGDDAPGKCSLFVELIPIILIVR